MYVRIEKPKLNRPTPEENIAVLDKWVSDTADKLNCFIQAVYQREGENDGK